MRLFVREANFYKTLIRLAIPIALQRLIAYAVTFADNLMIGKLGEYAISGVYMGGQIQSMLQFIVLGFSGGALIIAAQYWGKKDTYHVKEVFALATRICLGFGLLINLLAILLPAQLLRLFTNDPIVVQEGMKYLKIVCFSYLFFCASQMLIAEMQAVETVRIGLVISIVSFFVNVSLNWVLIFGKLGMPAMGIRGAAVATLVSRIVEAGVMFVYVLAVDQKLKIRMRDFLLGSRAMFRDLLRYGAPVLAGQVVWGFNQLAQSAIIGHMSASAISAVSVAGTLSTLLFMLIMGLRDGLGIITGKTVGKGDYERMKQYAVTAQIIFLLLGFVTAAIILLVKDAFISLYELTPESVAITKQFMLVLAVASIGRNYQATCLSGLVKSGGDTSFVFKNDTIFVFCVVLPSALIAQNVFHAAPWVVYACLLSDQVLKCFVAVVKINRFKWMKNLTRPAELEESKC